MKKSFITILALIISIFSYAQKQTVKGVVISGEDNLPIPGAAIFVPSTTVGTITDFDGNYQLILPDGTTQLVFSFLGMKKQTVAVGGKTTIDITLENESVGLEEVVVTAFGIKREKKALGYAVQELSGTEIVQIGQPNMANALQGKIAGVVVKQSSGMPGASAQLTIRGSRSLSYNNQPLYVVDGMPIESDASFDNDPESGTDASSRILDINPDDIESISVLKGPTASALYGLRASNGVVVITTKSGKNTGNKTLVSFHSSYTFDQVSRLPSLQQKYAQGEDSLFKSYSSYSWGPVIDSMKIYTNQLGEQETAAAYDNITPFFQNGNSYLNSFGISGSGEMGNYSIGFGATNMNGIIPTTGMERYTSKFNGVFAPFKKVKVGVSANYSDVRIDKIPGGSNYSNPLLTTYFAPSSYNLWDKPYEYPDNEFVQYNYRYRMDNPRWALEHNKFTENNIRFFGNLNFSYAPSGWLIFAYRIGIDNFVTTGKEVLEIGSGQTGGRADYLSPTTSEYLVPTHGQIDKYIFDQTQINSNASLTIDRYFGENFHINILFGNEIYDIQTGNALLQGKDFMMGGFHNLSNTVNQLTFERRTHQRVFGLFTNMAFEFKSLLFLTVSGRNDMVSNMPRDNRSFFYPSLAMGFVFTEIGGLQDNQFFPFGKIRVSLAQVGQAGPIYGTQTVYTMGGHYNSYIPTGGYRFPVNSYSGFTAGNSINSGNLLPQNTSTMEFGIDLRFFNNRIGIDFSYYQIDATDQIYRVPVARSTGYIDELRNGGEIQTQGEEIVLTLKPIDKQILEWDISANFSMFNNEVIKLEDDVDRLPAGTKNFNSFGVYGYAGYSFPVIYGSTYVRDQNNNIVVDSRATTEKGDDNPMYGQPLIGEHDVLGNVQPDFTLGVNSTLRYKSLSLNVSIDVQKGGHIYSGMNSLLRAYGLSEETLGRDEETIIEGSKGYFDSQTGELIVEGVNDITIKKDKAYWDDALYYIAESAVFETSFARLRNVTITLDIPATITEKVKIRAASIYISGRNLLLITDYPNFDPESSTSSGNGSGGYEYVSLPNSRSFGAGIRLKF